MAMKEGEEGSRTLEPVAHPPPASPDRDGPKALSRIGIAVDSGKEHAVCASGGRVWLVSDTGCVSSVDTAVFTAGHPRRRSLTSKLYGGSG